MWSRSNDTLTLPCNDEWTEASDSPIKSICHDGSLVGGIKPEVRDGKVANIQTPANLFPETSQCSIGLEVVGQFAYETFEKQILACTQ